MFMYHVPAWYRWKSEEGIRCPGCGVTDACEPPSQYWGLNSFGKWAGACNCWVALPAPYLYSLVFAHLTLFMGSLLGSFQNLSIENCNIMHISVCEFHDVFQRIKLHNYYYLDKLEVLVSPGCTTSSFASKCWYGSFLSPSWKLWGKPSLIHTDFI